MVVAELALQKLDAKAQRLLEQQAYTLIKKQDTQRRLYLIRTFPGSSSFAQMSVFADTQRKLSLADLYASFGSMLPARFTGLADTDTRTWHYKNQPVQMELILAPGQEQPQQCNLSQPTDIAWAIEQMREAVAQADSEENKILALAMLVHFVADAHQPLHAMSRVDEDCDSDLGGNRFCVKYRSNSYSCETNLHALWDSALGFFEDYETVAEGAKFVGRVELDEQQAENLDVDEWLAEGYRMARLVYSIKDGSGGDPYYISEGQVISYRRLALAAERLALILEDLYPVY